MTAETVVRSQLQAAIPRLLQEATVVALTPAADDLRWAAGAAWAIARAVARTGRRVALVDVSVTQPVLNPNLRPEEAEAVGGKGIVDAFQGGASLQRVVQKGDLPGLFFIGSGSPTADPERIWNHERWDHITRGFGEEGALLLLFIPSAAWPSLRPSVDRIITLGAMRDSRGTAARPGWSGQGVPVVHLIPDPPEPQIPDASVALWSSHIAKHRPGRSRVWRVVLIGLAILALAALGLVVGRSLDRLAAGRTDAGDSARAPAPFTPPAVAPSRPVPVEGDSLYYAVQVAAFKTRGRALDQAANYEEQGWPTTLTPVQLGLQGLWYRVMVGAFASPAAADSALRQFYQLGLLQFPSGSILRTPHVLAVRSHRDSAAAAADAAGLREVEIPAYIVEASGVHRVVVGAFETPEQAELMDSILVTAGVTGALALRRGRIP